MTRAQPCDFVGGDPRSSAGLRAAEGSAFINSHADDVAALAAAQEPQTQALMPSGLAGLA